MHQPLAKVCAGAAVAASDQIEVADRRIHRAGEGLTLFRCRLLEEGFHVHNLLYQLDKEVSSILFTFLIIYLLDK